MIISLMGNFGKSFGQTCDENWIRDGLKELGIKVFENEIPEKVDLILTFKTNKYGKEDIKKWKEENPETPVWIWTFDNMDRFPYFYDIARNCDLWLGEELGRKSRFESDGLPFYYFPYHAVPVDTFKKVEGNQIWDVVFAGTPYGSDYRPDKFELLKAIQAKYNLGVWGNNEEGWKAQGIHNVFPAMFDENLAQVYSQAKIVLAISNCQCEGYWSIRTTQALMCGAFVLARFTPQMEKELKDNVVYFQDIDDCLAKIDYALKHPEQREAIASRGHLYAQMYLSTKQRLKELLILYENRKSLI